MTHNLRERRISENCWCGALAHTPCLAIKSGKPMRTYRHLTIMPNAELAASGNEKDGSNG